MKAVVEEATVNANTTVEADKESVKDTKKSAQKSSSDIPVSKSRFKKKPVFSARKLPKKVPDGSESDEEDVRMENINPTINTTQVSLNDDSNSEVEETKPKIALPKIQSVAKKILEPRTKHFGIRMNNDKKLKRPKTNFIPPANQDALLSRLFDECEKMFEICECYKKMNEAKVVDEKKPKRMMDFGSEAEYTDEDTPEVSPPPEEKKDEIKEKEIVVDEPALPLTFKARLGPKQFQHRQSSDLVSPKNSPRKHDSNDANATTGW
uniref:Uncharacterized protein n=1 Tax=Panagrolaimus davidi TaxID=227884 RepID=A0A914QEQ1_9BILA